MDYTPENPNPPWEWNTKAPPFLLLPPPQPLLSIPFPNMSFRVDVDARPPNMLNPAVSDQELSPPYAALTSPVFTRQVPPTCLPHLRIPPPNPPRRGENFFDPYDTPPFIPTFGILFQAVLDEDKTKYDEIVSQLAEAIENFGNLPLDEQLTQFMYARTLSAEQVRIRWQVVADLLFILRQEFPLCEVHAFGSVISGLGDISSDIDIYADLLGPYAQSPMTPRNALFETKRVFKKARCPHSGRTFNDGPGFAIVHARVPVFKLKHFGSGLCYDLTFENRLSAQNSRLVVLYTNMDPRVFRFMVLLRYWLKFHNLSGPNAIKNYALILMALVYLMQKGIIPSVHLLQNLKETERKEQGLFLNPDEINGWDASFCGEPDTIHKHFEATPLPPDFQENPAKHMMELMCGFFKTFANMDLGNVVICPLLGEIILKGGFMPGNEVFLTDMLGRYKKFAAENDPSERLKLRSFICVQDPFVLNFNVTSGALLSTVLKFQIACAKSADVIMNKLQKENDEKISILDLFTPLPTHLHQKDLFKSFRIYLRTNRFRKEIFGILGVVTSAANDEEVEQKNKFIKLPRHLKCMDRLLDQDTYEIWQKQNPLADALSLSPHQQFSTLFLDEVARCRLELDAGVTGLAMKMASLWKGFAVDFLKEFFAEALKFEIIGEMKEVFTEYQLRKEDFCGTDTPVKWTIRVPDRKLERGEELRKMFENKIAKIDETPADKEVYYGMLSIMVTYPFWSRQFSLPEWGKDQKKILIAKKGKVEYYGNPIEIERLITESFLERYNKKVAAGKGKQGEGDEGQTDKHNEEDVQVVEEPRSHKKKRKMNGDMSFVPFRLDVLVKLTARVGDKQTLATSSKASSTTLERPGITVLFQSKTKEENILVSTSKLYSLFNVAFSEYQKYRLMEWLREDDAS